MNLQAEKLELVEFVSGDWFDDLTADQKEAIDRSIKKLDSGEKIPHSEVAARLGLEHHSHKIKKYQR